MPPLCLTHCRNRLTASIAEATDYRYQYESSRAGWRPAITIALRAKEPAAITRLVRCLPSNAYTAFTFSSSLPLIEWQVDWWGPPDERAGSVPSNNSRSSDVSSTLLHRRSAHHEGQCIKSRNDRPLSHDHGNPRHRTECDIRASECPTGRSASGFGNRIGKRIIMPIVMDAASKFAHAHDKRGSRPRS